MLKTLVYANKGGGQTPVERQGLPRTVLADLRAEGWSAPYVVRELVDNKSADE